jgi:2-iminobutanoate/2-iminopropanoate deaminase
MKEEVKTANAPAAIGPYSQGIKTNGLIFVSGQIPVNPRDGVIPDGIEAQTKQVIHNIAAILREKGLTLDNVLKTTVFLKNLSDFAVMNDIYQSFFKAPYPTRSTVEVSGLPKGALVEIECIAFC